MLEMDDRLPVKEEVGNEEEDYGHVKAWEDDVILSDSTTDCSDDEDRGARSLFLGGKVGNK